MSGGRTQTIKPMKHPKLNGGQRPVGVDQDSCISERNLKHSKLNGGQRPVGLDRDRIQTPKVNGDSLVKKRSIAIWTQWRIRSSPGGNVRWKNSDSEANEASEAQRGATSGGLDQDSCISKKHLKHSKLNGGQRPVGLDQDSWDMGTLAEGNAVETVGNARHVERTKHCTGGKHGKHKGTGGDCWDMRTLPEGNAVETVGNARHVERTKHCTGGKHGKQKGTGGDCWDMRTLPEGNAVKTVGNVTQLERILTPTETV